MCLQVSSEVIGSAHSRSTPTDTTAAIMLVRMHKIACVMRSMSVSVSAAGRATGHSCYTQHCSIDGGCTSIGRMYDFMSGLLYCISKVWVLVDVYGLHTIGMMGMGVCMMYAVCMYSPSVWCCLASSQCAAG